jgi:hypothetical protein
LSASAPKVNRKVSSTAAAGIVLAATRPWPLPGPEPIDQITSRAKPSGIKAASGAPRRKATERDICCAGRVP